MNAQTKHDIGATVSLGADDCATLEAAEQRVLSLQTALGCQLEEFEQLKAKYLHALSTAKQEHGGLLMTLARKYSINTDSNEEQWEFNRERMQFERKR